MQGKTPLEEAAEVVNTHRRAEGDPPLVYVLNCSECGEQFAMLPQDLKLSEKRGHPKTCRLCKGKK
jgi:hypothetical protein